MADRDAELQSKDPTWTHGLSMECQSLDIRWANEETAYFEFPSLGWKAPLWRRDSECLWLLRPQGLWKARLPDSCGSFLLLPDGLDGWSSRRGIFVDSKPSRAWRDQNGVVQDPREIDAMALPPAGLPVDASGEISRWQLTPEGRALCWLDDSFEAGPLSIWIKRPYMVVSDGKRKVAFIPGEGHWSWPMVEEGLISIGLGRGGGWEAESIWDAQVIDMNWSWT